MSFVKSLFGWAAHHHVFSKILQTKISSNFTVFGREGDKVCINVVCFEGLDNFPVNSIASDSFVADQGLNSNLADDSFLEILGNKFGVAVSLEIRSDTFGSFKIVVDFFSIEDIEDELTAGMHEIFINVVHHIVDYDVPDSFFFVVVE